MGQTAEAGDRGRRGVHYPNSRAAGLYQHTLQISRYLVPYIPFQAIPSYHTRYKFQINSKVLRGSVLMVSIRGGGCREAALYGTPTKQNFQLEKATKPNSNREEPTRTLHNHLRVSHLPDRRDAVDRTSSGQHPAGKLGGSYMEVPPMTLAPTHSIILNDLNGNKRNCGAMFLTFMHFTATTYLFFLFII